VSAPVFCCVCQDEPVACEFCLGKGNDIREERLAEVAEEIEEMDGNDDDYPSDGLETWNHDTWEEKWGLR